MLHDTPLRKIHLEEARRLLADRGAPEGSQRPGAATGSAPIAAEPEYIPWGPPSPGGDQSCEVLAALGSVEIEYAHLRRDCGRIDGSSRGTILVEGEDAVDFLDRMLSQKLAGMQPGQAAMAFLVDRKGRIQADLLLACTRQGVLIDLDIHQVESTLQALEHFIFSEDVRLSNASNAWHRLGCHGPGAIEKFSGVEPLEVLETELGGVQVHVTRVDCIGSPGFVIFVPFDDAAAAWEGLDCGTVGWYAYNMARIEGGTPLCNVDFGPDTLPHETALVDQRVSFSKGCYPGQEIVARMEHLGKPKQILRGFRMESGALPVAGAQVFASGEGDLGTPIGVVTSSCLSPMLGSASIGFAMLRTALSEPGTHIRIHDEGDLHEGCTGPLRAGGDGLEANS